MSERGPSSEPPGRREELDARALEVLRAELGAEAATAASAMGGPRPAAVALPSTVEQASLLMRLAREHAWQVIPSGAGTWLALPQPRAPQVVVSTARMDQIHEYEPADPGASLGAGVRLGPLAEQTAAHRQRLPWDPPGARGATVGAIVALGAAGPLRQGYGTPREHVLGMQVVTGDGRVLSVGGRVLKNVAGYDLTRLYTGSRGALGLITRLHVRLRALPEADSCLALLAPGAAACLDFASRARHQAETAAVELLSPALGASVGFPAGRWVALVRIEGERETVAKVRSGLESAALGEAAELAEVPPSVWAALDSAERGAAAVVRLAHRAGSLAATLELAQQLAPAFPAALFAAHGGEGIVRLLLPDVAPGPSWAQALANVHRVAIERGGSFIGEPAYSPLLGRAAELENLESIRRLMRGLKRVFDPHGVLWSGGFDLAPAPH